MNKQEKVLLLYDGECGFCNASVQFIIRNEGDNKSMVFASLHGKTAAQLLNKYPHLQEIDSLILVQQYGSNAEKLFWYSSGVVELCRYLGGKFLLVSYISAIVPTFIADAVYKYIASVRKKLWQSGNDVCLLLPPEVQRRFLP